MLKLENISKSFNGKEIFNNINFVESSLYKEAYNYDNEKLGLIGRNGSGKSTLLKIISGELEYDNGNIITSKNYRIGYLQQHLKFTEKNIVEEVSLSLPDYKKDNFWEVEKVLCDIGFSQNDLQRSPDEFSGGWQIRLNLAKLLVSEADLLLLDEPTNYLDIISIRWLKCFLKKWKKSFILITHDRTFLNEVITHTLIIHRGTSKKITGNVDEMYEQIAVEEETYEKTRINEEKKKEQIQKYIDRFRYKATLASQVQSKIKMLDRQDVKDQLQNIQNLDFEFNYKNIITNKPFIEVKSLTFGYDKNIQPLIRDFSFKVEKGDKICVVGKNGKGKSTLLKLLIGEVYQDSGDIDMNPKVEIGYFGQMNINRLNLQNTIEDELWDVDRTIPRNKILNVAGTMMFSGDDYKKHLNILSGGEKSRVLLGKIILKSCNLLLLDEPTNHLDMESCISLMEAVNNFNGASIIVTHNEDFLNNVATKLIVFDDDKVFVFDGDYKYFLEKIGWSNEEKELEKSSKSIKSKNKQEQKPKISNKNRYNLKKKEKLEEEIFNLELKIEENILAGNYNVADLQAKINEKNKELEELVNLL